MTLEQAGINGNRNERTTSTAKSAIHLTTSDICMREREEFWREVVCKNFVDIEFTSRVGPEFSAELHANDLGGMIISRVEASAHTVRSGMRRSPREDSIYAIAMLSGGARIEQDAREVFLRPGDFTFCDATRPHHLAFNQSMNMLIVHIPRARLRDSVAGLEHCTARHVNGSAGVGAVVSSYMRVMASQLEQGTLSNQAELAECTFDLLSAAISSVRPDGILPSRSRALSLSRVKDFIEQHLSAPNLNADAISIGVGLSARYINTLFDDEGASNSLLRYVWARRLEQCRRDLGNPAHLGHRVSDIAHRWGFNDHSHFSRAFRARFKLSPRQFREQEMSKENLSRLNLP